MPIRTPRGRSAAYRALWQWPLRSPGRLAVCVVLVLGAVIGVVTAVGALQGTRAVGSAIGAPETSTAAAPRTGTVSQPSTSTATILPPVPELTPSSLPVTAAPSPALSVAARWAAAWVDHPQGITPQQWVDGLRPFTTDEYLGVLTGVDPANVPATTVVGEPRAVRVAARSVQVDVRTNALTLRVLVVATEDGWRVAGYEKA
jgi:hypothetical protein